MKKEFTTPTIEKVQFVLSDPALCTENVVSGTTTDGGSTSMTESQLGE